LTLLENLNRQIPTVFKRTAEQEFRKVMLRAIKDKSYAENLKKAFRDIRDINDSISDNISEKDKKAAYATIDTKTQRFLWDLLCIYLYQKQQVKLIRNMSLIYLVAEFESFLRKILEATFLKKPESLASSHKTITVEELVKFKDVA
jgi:predicted ester cyclase